MIYICIYLFNYLIIYIFFGCSNKGEGGWWVATQPIHPRYAPGTLEEFLLIIILIITFLLTKMISKK